MCISYVEMQLMSLHDNWYAGASFWGAIRGGMRGNSKINSLGESLPRMFQASQDLNLSYSLYLHFALYCSRTNIPKSFLSCVRNTDSNEWQHDGQLRNRPA
jgi:hypothetical protein